MDKTFVSEIRPHQTIESPFILQEKQLRVARNGTRFLTLKLSDKTGEIIGRIWDRAEEYAASIPSRGLVLVKGQAEEFRNELQLQISEISALAAADANPSDYLPASSKNPDELVTRLKSLLVTVKRRPLRKLIERFFEDEDLIEQFKTAPAAKSMHHAYLGGLLEHTVSVTGLVSKLCEFYSGLDRDLLMVGAALHDIGKVEEFSYDFFIDYSHSGRLLGHMVLGIQIVQEKIRKIKAFPEEDKLLLKHLILSHHGEPEFGAVKLPMTREAFVLHFADDLDAKLNSVTRILEESIGADEAWTSYQPIFDRFFFRGFPTPPQKAREKKPKSTQDEGRQLRMWLTEEK